MHQLISIKPDQKSFLFESKYEENKNLRELECSFEHFDVIVPLTLEFNLHRPIIIYRLQAEKRAKRNGQ